MKILAINPGSTSTKIAVYTNEELVWQQTIRHSVEELAPFAHLLDQYQFRKHIITSHIEAAGIAFEFDAIIGRGGLVKPIAGGVYEVNDALRNALTHVKRFHASNLGGLLAAELALQVAGCRAFIADPVVVDELDDVARLSGSPLLPRISIFHALNHKAIARRFAKGHGVPYESLNLIVCHLGGGISVGVHRQGRVVDVNNALDGEGPFSPERAGTLPAGQLIDLCFSGEYTREELQRLVSGRAGLIAHLGSTDVKALVDKAIQGDEKVALVLHGMIYTTAKAVGGAAAALCGKVDAILLTGGMAHNGYLMDLLKKHIGFLGEVHIFPGEDEMGALATNALGALRGELEIKEYAD